MDREQLILDRTAAKQGMSLHRNDDGTWSLGMAANPEPLTANKPRAVETFISGNRIRFADGRVFPRRMTTAELKAALGIEE